MNVRSHCLPLGPRAFELLAAISCEPSRVSLKAVQVPGPWWERLSSRDGGSSARLGVGVGVGGACGRHWNWLLSFPAPPFPHLQPQTLKKTPGAGLRPYSVDLLWARCGERTEVSSVAPSGTCPPPSWHWKPWGTQLAGWAPPKVDVAWTCLGAEPPPPRATTEAAG